jgi:formylmethanofuran dehydrogenase subunit E
MMSNEWKDYQNDLRAIFNDKMWETGFLYDGWQKAFVSQMMDELFNTLGPYVEDFMAHQIKEKYGSLTIYWGWKHRDYTDEENHDRKEIDDAVKCIVEKYRKISEHTCVQCGEKAVLLSTGWVLPFCNNCYDRKMGVFGIIED